jgi:hypothetical protein
MGVSFPGVKLPHREAAILIHLELSLRIRAAIGLPALPHTPSWRGTLINTGITLRS